MHKSCNAEATIKPQIVELGACIEDRSKKKSQASQRLAQQDQVRYVAINQETSIKKKQRSLLVTTFKWLSAERLSTTSVKKQPFQRSCLAKPQPPTSGAIQKPLRKMSLRRTRSDSTKAERSRASAAAVIVVDADSAMHANDTSGSSDAMAPPTAKQLRSTSSTGIPTQLRQQPADGRILSRARTSQSSDSNQVSRSWFPTEAQSQQSSRPVQLQQNNTQNNHTQFNQHDIVAIEHFHATICTLP